MPRAASTDFMTTTMAILLCLLLLTYVVPNPLRASDTPPPLSTILAGVIARDQATQKNLKSLQYHQVLETERLDAQDKVTQKQEIEMIVRPGAADEMQVISEKGDNLPANPDQAHLQAQGKQFQKQKFDFPLKEMISRYTITLAGEETLRGQPVYVLAFEPKPDQPYRNQTEKVLNHLRGRTWVSTRDYSVLKTEASLAEPVNVAWIFAKISTLDFHYELDNAPGELGPAQVKTSVEVNAPFLTVRQRMKVDLSQFEPLTKI
jgi:hypothetical protein